MMNEFENESFGCLKSFSNLNGWQKQIVFVGNSADARTSIFLFEAMVLNNWPSQWHTRHRAGYIRLRVLEPSDHLVRCRCVRFDLADQTIRGKQVFLFLATPEIDILWRRQTLKYRIRDFVDKMAPKDRFAAELLVRELADPEAHDPRLRRYRFPEALEASSVSELEALGELFAMPCDHQKIGAFLAAA